MLDLKRVRESLQAVRDGVAAKGRQADWDRLLALDERRRAAIVEVEKLKAERNRDSQEVAKRKREGKDAADLIERQRQAGERMAELDAEVAAADSEIREMLLRIPNLPHESVPRGPDASANRIVKAWGEPRRFEGFAPKPHWDLGPALDILDLDRGTKVSGSAFYFLKGAGALLERALLNFMLDLHTREKGYREVFPPYLVNRATGTGTGQLPLHEEEMYRCERDDLFLLPTAEVPVTNLHRDEVLPAESLPVKYAAYSACFRREAGAAGRATRGIIRVHQFSKVELVKFVRPERSYDELESLLADAETVLQRLNLAYRVVLLSTGDMTFSSAKTYDLEVWAPGAQAWLEVSSCSNFEAYQARRANIRFKDGKGKPDFVHTLNGSGLALPRLWIAVVESGQQADGSIVVPEPLRPYMGGLERIASEKGR